jgi:uncharacterized membrane protein YkvA (DUF1232 family)
MLLKPGPTAPGARSTIPTGWIRGSVYARPLVALLALIGRELKVYMQVAKDDRTPRASKILLWVGVGYAIWPLGLVPDFIPIVGYVDDVIIVPILVFFAVRRVPSEVMAECRSKVVSAMAGSTPGTGLEH